MTIDLAKVLYSKIRTAHHSYVKLYQKHPDRMVILIHPAIRPYVLMDTHPRDLEVKHDGIFYTGLPLLNNNEYNELFDVVDWWKLPKRRRDELTRLNG